MNNSDNKELDLLLERYQETAFMIGLYKEKLLTLEEIMILNRILIGCTKFVERQSTKVSSRKGSKKTLANVIIYSQLTLASQSKFKTSNMRDLLPDDLKNIDSAALSRSLNVFVKTGIIEKSHSPKSKRGKPSAGIKIKQGGIKSYFQGTEYIQKVRNIIAKPVIRSLIFSYLFESKVIERYLQKTFLLYLRQLRIIGPQEVSRMYSLILKKTVDTNNNLYEAIKPLNESQLRILADKLARKELRGLTGGKWQRSNELYDSLYIFGSLYYYG